MEGDWSSVKIANFVLIRELALLETCQFIIF